MNPILRRFWPYLALFAILSTALGWQYAQNPAHEERDIVQERLDYAAPPLTMEHSVGQTFLSRHDGLKAIELLLVLYRPDEAPPPSARILLELERLDAPQPAPLIVEINATGLEHNQRLRFPFSPLNDSKNATYRLTLGTNGDYGISFWACQSDAYASGTLLIDGQESPGDLYFTTSYDYHLAEILQDVGKALASNGYTALPLILLLSLPGLALCLYLVPPGRLDLGAYLALMLALSMAVWPLLLLWSTAIGVRLGKVGAWVIIGLLLASVVYRAWALRGVKLLRPLDGPADRLAEITLGLVLLVVLATRLVQVRELIAPAWVDSVHHTLITKIISERGMIPSSLEPYVSLHDFHYHFGFHANAAVLTWLSGLQPHEAVLLLGQVLNAMAALSAYAITSWFTKRRWSGVIAAVVVGCLLYMPAYYVSWGRYTQLSGLILLPLACLMTTWLWRSKGPRRGILAATAILVAGLALTHYRVLIFYVLFWPAYSLLILLRERGGRSAWTKLFQSALPLGGLALLAILPWAWRFLSHVIPHVDTIYGGWGATKDLDTSLPLGLLNVGLTRTLLYIAGAGVLWAMLRRKVEIVLLPVWIGLWLLIANLHLLGLRDIWLIHNSSVVISFWLPVGVLCGWLVGDVINALKQIAQSLSTHPVYKTILSIVLAATTLALAAWGSWRMVDTINPVTILLREDDVRAIEWAQENIPSGARFLVNTRPWQGELRVGTDGGWWLPLLSEHEVTLPCVFYYQGAPTYRERVNDLARIVEEAESLDDSSLREQLIRAGVTHVFTGANGGRLLPKDLDPSPYYQLRYASGPARIYEFMPTAHPRP